MLIESKSNLARLMATENLVIEERNVPTAYFDVGARVLTVPILNGNLSSYLYDLLLGHEVGHALETPAQGWHNSVTELKVNKSILNVCEDVRIEKKIKRKFPGLKPSFIKGYNELLDMDFFGVKDVDLNTLNFIDRANLYTKGGAAQNINFSSEEKELLKEMESTETWEQVVEVARKIQTFMKAELEKEKENKKEKQKLKIKLDLDDSSEEGDNPLPNISFDEDGDIEIEIEISSKTDKSDMDKKKESEESAGDSDEKGEKGQESSNSGATAGRVDDSEVESKTDNFFREKEKNLYSENSKKDTIYANIPKVNIETLVVSHKDILAELHRKNAKYVAYDPAALRSNFVKFKNESNKVVSYLVKEFELRKNAEQQSRAKVSKTGELNMNRIHEYKLTDDLFARMTKVPNGKSHGLMMFIDWSGSMDDKINVTIRQLLNLVMFCKKVNIPFDVYAFSTQWNEEEYNPNRQIQTPKIGDLYLGEHFSLLNLFNNRMTAREYSEMASFLLNFKADRGLYRSTHTSHMIMPSRLALGGTPLNHTIVAAFEMIPEFKKNNKVDIVNAVFLTDGESGVIASRYTHINPYTKKMEFTPDARPSYHNRMFLRDPVTKASVEITYGQNQGSGETIALLRLLKQRADCNLLGFFIGESRNMRMAFDLYGSFRQGITWSEKRNQVDKLMVEFRKEKTYVMEDVGYDEYYLIATSTLDTDEEEMNVKSTTTRGLVSAFSKYTGEKINSRVILNRFIKMIA